MGQRIDLHLHTKRYSRDSSIDPYRLIEQAIRAGLDGVVITEHHHQWSEDELRELCDEAGEPGFVCLSGFEYTSAKGDLLIYGLSADDAHHHEPRKAPEMVAAWAVERGGVCIAAHPTRAGLGFDERIMTLPLAGLEVRSVNLKPHETRLAMTLSQGTGVPATAASDAHRLKDVGRYCLEFSDPIQGMPDLQRALSGGRFRIHIGKEGAGN